MRVVVVGAGIAGLSAGFWLQQAGHEVTVLEAQEQIGGRAQLFRRPGSDDWLDVGTQYYHSNYALILQLIADVGLSAQRKTIGGATRFYVEDGRASFLVTPQRPWIAAGGIRGNWQALVHAIGLLRRDKGSTFAVLDGKDTALDQVSGLDSVNRPFVRDYIVRMLSLVGGLSEPALANVSALQIRRLLRIILTTDYIGLQGGTASLHQALAERLDVRLGCRAAAVRWTGGRASGVALADGGTIPADHVVVATPPQAAAALLPRDWTGLRRFLGSIRMSAAILPHLFLDRPLEPGVWTHFLPLHHQGAVQFFVDTQQKSPERAPSGKATMQGWILSPKSDGLMDEDDDHIIAAAVRDLEMIMPGAGRWVEGAHVTRHRQAIPQMSVGHDAACRRFLAEVDRLAGISFCGDYLSGGYAECAAWSARRVADRIGPARGDVVAFTAERAAAGVRDQAAA